MFFFYVKRENEIHFHHFILFHFRKLKKYCASSKIYLPFIEMVTQLKVAYISVQRLLEVEILIQKSKNHPTSEIRIKYNPGHTTRDIAEIVHISHMSVVSHLKILGSVNHYTIFVPHDFTEKYIFYDNVDRKMSWENKMSHN